MAPTEEARIDEMVRDFRAIREFIERETERFKERMAPYLARKEELTWEMLAFLDGTAQKSARTDQGTVTATVDRTVSCSDPDMLVKFVRTTGLLELLDRRPNKTACWAYADEHGGEAPPGVKLNSTRNVSVRKPS